MSETLRILIYSSLAALLFFSAVSSAQAAAWRTTQFEVYRGSPQQLRTGDWRRAVEQGDDPDRPMAMCPADQRDQCDQAVAELETFLHEFAVTLQNEGFADPTRPGNIDSIYTGADGRDVVRIYLYSFVAAGQPDRLGAFRACDGRDIRRVIIINTRDMFRGSRVTTHGFQNAAHELFHTVQFASAFRSGPKGCDIGKWITEGTADAVGFDYVKRLRPSANLDEYRPDDGWIKPWGVRRYSYPLSDPGGETGGYQTMSFWRHLAELNAARGKAHPGAGEAEFDYRYLISLFKTPVAHASPRGELTWLDRWMKSQDRMEVGLAPIYAQFVATMSDYLTHRMPVYPRLHYHNWPTALLGQCKEIRLSATSPGQREIFRLREAGTLCAAVTVEADGYQPVEITIQNSDISKAGQQQLRIGVRGGQLVARPEIRIMQAPAADAGKSKAWWRFLTVPGIPNYFTISNMASIPGDSRAESPILHFSVPDWDSTMTDKSPAPTAANAERKQPKTPQEVKRYKKSLRSRPTTQSAMAVMSGTDLGPPDTGCTGELQALNLCGPQLHISLGKDFGLMPGQGPVASTGGMISQSVGQYMEPGEEQAFALQLKNMGRNNKGNFINLSIPRIGYGQTGSFSNARIDVTGDIKGEFPDSYSAISPTPVTLSSSGKVHPPAGRVTITEYTPHILRGTFNATLVSKEAVKLAQVNLDNPILPTAGSISGSFTVSAPWRGNGAQLDTGPDSTMMEGIRDDMMSYLTMIPEDMRGALGGGPLTQLCKLGFDNQQLAALGIDGSCGGAGAAALAPACECDCVNWQWQQTHQACAGQCEQEWKDWACGPYLETGLGELDAETLRYQTAVQQADVPSTVGDSWVSVFRDSPPGKRAGLWQELEQYLAQRQQADRDTATQIAEIRSEQAQRGQNYDEETRRYESALETAGSYTQAEVDGLVEVFAIAPAAVRQVFWGEIQ